MAENKHPDENYQLHLPDEVLETIFKAEVLTISDIFHIGLSCSRFKGVVEGKEIWKCKFLQRWPVCGSRLILHIQRNADWKTIYRQRLESCKMVRETVRSMSPKYYRRESLPREACCNLFSTIDAQALGHIYVMDELHGIIYDGNRGKNLTEKYYAERTVKIIKHWHLKQQLPLFLQRPAHQQLIEDGACILAQWCQNDPFTVISIMQPLDDIAGNVREQVQKLHPRQFDFDANSFDHNDIEVSAWSPRECRRVLEAVNIELFTNMRFKGNVDDYYDTKNSFINMVLSNRTGNPIALCVVYLAVARRLGVVCHPVNFPAHFLIKFLEHPQLEGIQQYTYIDPFNGGTFLDAHECTSRLGTFPTALLTQSSYETVSTRSVLERMIRNLYYIAQQRHNRGEGLEFLLSILELTNMVDPQDSVKINLARLYLSMNINLEEIEELLRPISESDNVDLHSMVDFLKSSAREMMDENVQDGEVVVKKRPDNPEVLYSVGQIMKHKRYHYTCVIYSWDKECRASMEWIHQMGVHVLPKGQWQPFYGVLVSDGSIRYAAQESLDTAEEPKYVTHTQVGKYFEEYAQTHYVMNNETAEKFPDDAQKTVCDARDKYG